MDEGQHLDPTAEISLETVKERSVKGIITLTGRTLVLNVISLIAQGLLWAYLSPDEFGVFFVVSAIVNFLVYFSDIGLAAALIQKKEKPDEGDLRTTFTIQQILVIVIIGIVFALTPFFKAKYSLDPSGQMLLYALCASLLMSSLKSIPSVLLERKLEFGKLVLPQVVEQLVYNIVLVFMAMKGFGLTSFTVAVLVRGVVGLAAIYALQPWKPGIAFSRKSLSGLLKFGLPYQVNSLLATLKDDGMTLVLGGILGTAGIGILGTAQRLSQYPLRFFMDNVTRVTFPAFSRMQDEKENLARVVTRSIFFICFLVFPAIVGLVILAPILVRVIPKYDKWTPALIPLTIVSVNVLFASFSTQITNLLNAIGKIKITFFLMIMWTGLTWALVPLLAAKFGVTGAAIGYAVVGVSSGIGVYIAKKYVNFSVNHSIVKPALGASAMAAVMLIVRAVLPATFYSVSILAVVGASVYGVVMFGLIGATLIEDVKKSLKTVFSK